MLLVGGDEQNVRLSDRHGRSPSARRFEHGMKSDAVADTAPQPRTPSGGGRQMAPISRRGQGREGFPRGALHRPVRFQRGNDDARASRSSGVKWSAGDAGPKARAIPGQHAAGLRPCRALHPHPSRGQRAASPDRATDLRRVRQDTGPGRDPRAAGTVRGGRPRTGRPCRPPGRTVRTAGDPASCAI